MKIKIDMTGRVCGQLTVLSLIPNTKRAKWVCRCSCGNEVNVDGDKLRSGHTKSCGCMHRPAYDRFIEKLAPGPNDCIEWTAGLDDNGYGQFWRGKKFPGDTGKISSHRWSYEHYVGAIPEGMHLDHLCRNRKCVNPEHLETVTVQENILRGVGPSAINAVKTHCPAGHEYSGDNLYVRARTGQRDCRRCSRNRAAEKRKRNREQNLQRKES